jgi:hypothetical protein
MQLRNVRDYIRDAGIMWIRIWSFSCGHHEELSMADEIVLR